jgi:hypothetical protein
MAPPPEPPLPAGSRDSTPASAPSLGVNGGNVDWPQPPGDSHAAAATAPAAALSLSAARARRRGDITIARTR